MTVDAESFPSEVSALSSTATLKPNPLGYVLEQELARLVGRTWRGLADERRAGRSEFPFVKLAQSPELGFGFCLFLFLERF